MKGEKFTAPPVSRLFAWRGPAAVFGLVVSVVVNSIYGVISGRTWPHIRKEVCERGYPPLTDGDAPSGVIGVVVAAVPHPAPDGMLWTTGHAVFSSRAAGFAGNLDVQAAATL